MELKLDMKVLRLSQPWKKRTNLIFYSIEKTLFINIINRVFLCITVKAFFLFITRGCCKRLDFDVLKRFQPNLLFASNLRIISIT